MKEYDEGYADGFAAGEDERHALRAENARLREERDLLNAILTNVALSMEAFDNYADIHAEPTKGDKPEQP